MVAEVAGAHLEEVGFLELGVVERLGDLGEFGVDSDRGGVAHVPRSQHGKGVINFIMPHLAPP